jgi:hypothetical protein
MIDPRLPAPGPFLGSWRVSEYVYNPGGAFVGVVRQRRELTRLENGDLRVWQFCEPCDFDHPVARRVGEYVFDLRVEGRLRRYLGLDVIGVGQTWGEGVVTGRGLWPRFGYSFTSFSVQTGAERQVTGGKFFEAGALIANIVGVAGQAGGRADLRGGSTWPGELGAHWRGRRRTVSADGTVLAEEAVARTYSGLNWSDEAGTLRLEPDGPRYRAVFKEYEGLAQRFGWMWEAELFGRDGASVEITQVLDEAGGQLIGLHRWQKDNVLDRVEVFRLTPIGGKDD